MKKLNILLLFVLLVSIFTSTAIADVSLTDMSGSSVVIKDNVERIVVLQPSDCEILFSLGLGDKIVGRGEYCNYPEEVLNIPAVSSGLETNIEQIIALNPNLVVMTMMSQSVEIKNQLDAVGIPVVVTNASSIAQVYEAVLLLGKATSTDEKAKEIVDDMKSNFESLSIKAKEINIEESIYFEVSPLQYGLWSTGKATFMDEIANICGLKNVFDDIEGWKEVSQEQIIERNPDNIVTISMYFGEGPTPVEEIVSREAWDNISAVKNNKVFLINGDLLSHPSPRLVEGATELFNLVYNIH